MNIGDFLEFQRAFERQRIGCAAAEIKHIPHLSDFARQSLDRALAFERLRDQPWDRHEFGNEPCLGRLVDRVARSPERHREAGKNRELTGEGFC